MATSRGYIVDNSENAVGKGGKLLIALVGGEIYEGILCSVTHEYITLSNVSKYPAAAKTNDSTRLKFYSQEIVAVSAFQTQYKPLRGPIPYVPIYYEQFQVLKQHAREYIYMSMVDERYYDAIAYLEKCDMIAVIGLGCDTGRCDTATMFSVATKFKVFLFDNVISNKRVIEMGLNKIFESKETKKIFHDCSGISDCLKHIYNVELDYVFDTMAADLVLRIDSEGNPPEELRGLPEVVSDYMKLPAGIIKDDFSTYPRKELLKRPLTDDFKLNLSLQTVYLFYLRQVLDRKMLEGFYDVVDAMLEPPYEGISDSSSDPSEEIELLVEL